MAMKLSTGKVAFPIEFDNGDKEVIYFNPNDPNLPLKLKDFRGKVSERIKGIDDVELDEKGEPKSEEFMEKFRTMQNILFEELDYAFGSEISAVVFKHCSPFAIVCGDYFIIQFLEAVQPEIEKHVKKANADVQKKMDKHIAKYVK